MKTVAEFKKEMIVGSEWGITIITTDRHSGKVTDVMKNIQHKCVFSDKKSFKLYSMIDNGVLGSKWPTKKEFILLDVNTIKINSTFFECTFHKII